MSQFYRNQPPEQPPHEPDASRSAPNAERSTRRLLDDLMAQLPPWLPRDPLVIGALFIAGAFGSFCLLSLCVLIALSERAIPRPSTPTLGGIAVVTPIIVTATPEITPLPPNDPSRIGRLLNPYVDANLEGMQALVLEVLDPITGNYVRSAPINANTLEMQQFITAFNIAQVITAPDFSCPDHVRFLVARADGSFISIGACLKDVVILRGAAIPNLGGNDLPMGPYFTDILTPYLPQTYQNLLRR